MRIDADRGRSFDSSSPVLAYWLANAEGFRVRAGRRRGTVEEVVCGADGSALQLVLRFGGRRAIVAAEDVERVVPVEELLVLRSVQQPPRDSKLAPATRHAAVLGGRGAVAVGHGSRRAAAASWQAADRGARAGWAGAQRAAAATGRATDRGARATWRETRRGSAFTWAGIQRLGYWLAPRVVAAERAAAAAVRAAAARAVAAAAALARWLRVTAPRVARAAAARGSSTAAEARAWLADRDRAPSRAPAEDSDGAEPVEPDPEPRGKSRQAA